MLDLDFSNFGFKIYSLSKGLKSPWMKNRCEKLSRASWNRLDFMILSMYSYLIENES